MNKDRLDFRPERIARNYILDAISSGRHGPGVKLPTERALSEQLGIPRSAVRSALAVLENSGHVTRRVGSGTFVAGGNRKEEPAAKAPNEATFDASPAQIMEARFLLEPRLAQLIAHNAKAADFAAMAEVLDESERTDDLSDFERHDAHFHHVMAAATHSPLVFQLYQLISHYRDHAEWGDLKLKQASVERIDLYRRQHREIFDALRSRNADKAEAAILLHLQTARKNLLGF